MEEALRVLLSSSDPACVRAAQAIQEQLQRRERTEQDLRGIAASKDAETARLRAEISRLRAAVSQADGAGRAEAAQASDGGPQPSSSQAGDGQIPDPDLADYEHPIGVEEFRCIGHTVVDWVADYYRGLEHLPRVRPDVSPGFLADALAPRAPEDPEPWAQVFRDFNEKLMPGVLHWQSPSFFSYFSANTSFPGLLAEMLSSATNQIGFSWAAAPVATELEAVMMDWLGELVGMPTKFLNSGGTGGGVIQGTSSEAVLVALLAARARSLRGAESSTALRLCAYASDQAHSCFKKACMIAGITNVRLLPTRPDDAYALQAPVLQAAIEADIQQGLLPCYVCLTIGTTSSCAVDPVEQLARVAHAARTGPAWVHVDAAFAGSAAVCPEQRAAHFQGLEELDSYSFNPHKWLLTNFECCALWAADAGPIKEALSLTPIFLQGAGQDKDLMSWQIPLGRRWRSLKLFFVLRCYGAQKLRAYIRHHCALAAWFAQQVQGDARFELAAPQRFSLVCFRLARASNEVNKALLDALNARGDLSFTHTELSGPSGGPRVTLRLAVGSAHTQLRHVQHAWAAVQAEATKLGHLS